LHRGCTIEGPGEQFGPSGFRLLWVLELSSRAQREGSSGAPEGNVSAGIELDFKPAIVRECGMIVHSIIRSNAAVEVESSSQIDGVVPVSYSKKLPYDRICVVERNPGIELSTGWSRVPEKLSVIGSSFVLSPGPL
jgi:hypothetical protein